MGSKRRKVLAWQILNMSQDVFLEQMSFGGFRKNVRNMIDDYTNDRLIAEMEGMIESLEVYNKDNIKESLKFRIKELKQK